MTALRQAAGAKNYEGEGLSSRDWAILLDLRRVRLLTGRHVQRLHLQDGSPLTQARRTRSVLQRMTDAGLLHRFERRIGGVHAGSSGYLYGLSTGGQRRLDGRGPAGGVRRRRPWEASRTFFDHVLGVSELYVRLREAARDGGFELVTFHAEPACWRHWTDVSGSRLIIKPDAFVVTAEGELAYPTFVELDRATESRTVLRRKAEGYVAYWQSGEEQAKRSVFPRVLWLVPDDRRLDQVIDALGRIEPDGWRLFQVIHFDQAVSALTTRPP